MSRQEKTLPNKKHLKSYDVDLKANKAYLEQEFNGSSWSELQQHSVEYMIKKQDENESLEGLQLSFRQTIMDLITYATLYVEDETKKLQVIRQIEVLFDQHEFYEELIDFDCRLNESSI